MDFILYNGQGTNVTVTGLTNGNTYNFRILIVDGDTETRWAITDISSIIPLPVNLTSLTAKATNQSTVLNWQTATEQNNSHFLLQHSTDGRQFETIGRVEGKGDSNEAVDYTYTHAKPATGMNYYRLQQFDFDGTNEYFGPVAVRFGTDAGQAVALFPNPTAARLQVELPESNQEWTLELYDLKGRLLLSQLVDEKTTNTSLDLSRLAAGQYLLLWQNGQAFGQERVVRL
ncbi:MAG: T9SS type A sorting domain-containing protein [Bacteroidota bacterium]